MVEGSQCTLMRLGRGDERTSETGALISGRSTRGLIPPPPYGWRRVVVYRDSRERESYLSWKEEALQNADKADPLGGLSLALEKWRVELML